MPLTHNLLHPKQRADLEKKLDPLKIALLVGLLIIIALVLWWIVQNTRVERLKAEESRLKEEWGQLEPRLQSAEEQRLIDTENLATAKAVIATVENRVYFAPILQLILEETPALVQLTSVSINYEGNSRITVTIDGKTAGRNESESRSFADRFRNNLRTAVREKYSEEATAEWYGGQLRNGVPITIKDRTLQTTDFNMRVEIPLPNPDAEGEVAPEGT